MKTITFIVLMFCFIIGALPVLAQERLIHYDRKNNRPFIVDNKTYEFKSWRTFFKNPEAVKLMESASRRTVAVQVLAGTGGGFMGFALADIIVGRRENTTDESMRRRKTLRGVFISGGALLLAIAIPIEIGSERFVREAVVLENEAIKSRAQQEDYLRLGIGMDGITLRYSF